MKHAQIQLIVCGALNQKYAVFLELMDVDVEVVHLVHVVSLELVNAKVPLSAPMEIVLRQIVFVTVLVITKVHVVIVMHVPIMVQTVSIHVQDGWRSTLLMLLEYIIELILIMRLTGKIMQHRFHVVLMEHV